jgi:hypothetical protein
MKKIKSKNDKKKLYNISSINVLDSFLSFQVQVVMLFYRAFDQDIAPLEVGKWDCVAMNLAPPYWTALGGLGSGCLCLGFLSGIGLLARQVLRSGPMRDW